MHLLAVVAVIAVVLFLILRQQTSNTAPAGWGQPGGADDRATALDADGHELAFLAKGKLFVHSPGREIREIHSPHVQSVVDRQERSRQLHGWKQDTAFARSFTGRRQPDSADDVVLQTCAMRFIGDGRMLYFLRDDRVGGLFEQDLKSGQEKRLVHKQNLAFEDLNPSPDGRQLLCSQHAANGSANICRMQADGSGYRELTGGDTVDSAPAWVPGEPHLVLFQTSGLARAPAGHVLALGPASIQLLDTVKGTVTPVLEDPKLDFLQPRVDGDGQLYFIRRPYEAPRYTHSNFMTDALLFPFRLLRALFHYLNFFSLMYTRKPLTSASGPLLEADLKEILVKGKRIDAEAALRKGESVNGVSTLVPKTWQLMARDRNGRERMLATHVVCFDIADDGSVYYSTGYGVFRLDRQGARRLVLKDRLIAELVVGPKPAQTPTS